MVGHHLSYIPEFLSHG